ncbi:hypothetical protein FPHOBKDP_00059 [Listeria phage LPJP1]|nr:hypothetical protein FPHOBKDP_00059 [Listeria phage LPJP1]
MYIHPAMYDKVPTYSSLSLDKKKEAQEIYYDVVNRKIEIFEISHKLQSINNQVSKDIIRYAYNETYINYIEEKSDTIMRMMSNIDSDYNIRNNREISTVREKYKDILFIIAEYEVYLLNNIKQTDNNIQYLKEILNDNMECINTSEIIKSVSELMKIRPIKYNDGEELIKSRNERNLYDIITIDKVIQAQHMSIILAIDNNNQIYYRMKQILSVVNDVWKVKVNSILSYLRKVQSNNIKLEFKNKN